MTSRSQESLIRFWCLIALCVAVVGQLCVLPLGPAYVGSAHAAEPTASLSVSGLSPEVYAGDRDGVVKLQTSGLSAAKGNLLVETFLQPTPFTSVEAFESFLDGSGFPGWRLTSDEVSASSIAADGSLTIAIPSEQMPWIDPNTTGTRGLTVRLTPTDTEALEARSALIYQPQEQEVQTGVNLTVISPVVPSFFRDSDDPDSDAVRLSQASTIEALAQTKGVSLSVLPGFFAGLDSDSSARKVLPSFKKHQDAILGQQVELVSRPDQDADLSLLAATEQSQLLKLARDSVVSDNDLTEPAWKTSRATLLKGVVSASNPGFTRHTLSALADMTLIAPAEWPSSSAPSDTSYFTVGDGVTPTAHLEIDPITGLLVTGSATDGSPEQPGSSVTVIDQWSFVSDLLARSEGSAAEELRIRQTLRTATLLVGLEDPSDRRTLMATLDVSRETGGDALVGRAKALLDNTWVDPVPLSDVIDSPESIVVRKAVPDWTIDNDPQLRAAGTQFSHMMDQYAKALSVANSTPEGTDILAPFTPQLLAPTTVGLVVRDRQALVAKASDALSSINQVIEVIPISQLNIVTTKTDFLVSVRNIGKFPISIVVSLHPSDPRLQSPESATITIAADGQESVKIPVTAVGSGDMDVQVQVTTLDGTMLDDSQIIPVRVRANWEDTGTIIAGSVLILLFVFGIIRTIRKSRLRSKIDLTEEVDAEGHAADKEAAAARTAWKPTQREEL